MSQKTPADEFATPSNYPLPDGHVAWEIRNDYPTSSDKLPDDDPDNQWPWLDVDFKTQPMEYCERVKKYFFDGNTESNFKKIRENKKHRWYHPPWLHYSAWGREPINGLKFGGWLDPGYFAKEQTQPSQAWLCSYFNWKAATILGNMWADKNRIPKWDKNLQFPRGSVICENIFCDNVDNVAIVPGCPGVEASVGKLPKDWKPGSEIPPNRPTRKEEAIVKTLRLIQVDFVARDERSPIGWVFGTFVCDGRIKADDPWEKVIPTGIQWGSDPDFLQKQYEEGGSPEQVWINPRMIELAKVLNANRPWLGWHNRLDGLADDFRATCTSCHATAQLRPDGKTNPRVQDPPPVNKNGEWVPHDEATERKWFRNIQSGEPFDTDSLSADYNIHVEMSYTNYRLWEKEQK